MGWTDKEGHYRNDNGSFSSPVFGSGLDQFNAGINENDTYISAVAKRDMAEALRSNYGGHGGGGGGVGENPLPGLLIVVIAVIATIFWFSDNSRLRLADNVETWASELAIKLLYVGAQYAPYSTYSNLSIPKKKRAKHNMAEGAAAWKCITVDRNCLRDAKTDSKKFEEVSLLALKFLKNAGDQGSADAMTDLGIYILAPVFGTERNDSPTYYGFDFSTPASARIQLACEAWEKATKMKPPGPRASDYLEQVQNSLLINGSKLVAKFLRGDLKGPTRRSSHTLDDYIY